MPTAISLPNLDDVALASLELEDAGLGPPLGQALDGPMATARRGLWQSDDGIVRVGAWQCAPGRFWTDFGEEGEFIRVLAGRLTCLQEGGPTTQVGPGDAMTFPAGWCGEWRIDETLRKVFVGWTREGAGPTDAPNAGATVAPAKIDGATVVGKSLTEGPSFAALDGGRLGTRGHETWKSADGGIETGIWECDAGRFHADFEGYGELIRIVAGEVVCSGDDGSAPFVLRPGDVMLFPRGWTGEWDVRSPLRKIYCTWTAR